MSDLHVCSECRLRQLEVERLVPLDQSESERRGVEDVPLDLGVPAIQDGLDVLCDGGVGADAVLVHERDEVRLGERRRRLRAPLAHLELGRLYALVALEPRHRLLDPPIVRIHAQVVTLGDHQALRTETLDAERSHDGRLLTDGCTRKNKSNNNEDQPPFGSSTQGKESGRKRRCHVPARWCLTVS